MVLVTGATGAVGAVLVAALTSAGRPVRCLVRDPRRLGPERVRVQVALGDLADPPSFRNALRGVEAVVHLAATRRDQARGSVEELTGVATWRLAEAAGRAGVTHFVLLGAQGASPISRARYLRAKAIAERAVGDSGVPHTILAPSLTYAPGEGLLRVLAGLSRLPAVPVIGDGRARFEPIWARDVAACAVAALGRPPPASGSSCRAPTCSARRSSWPWRCRPWGVRGAGRACPRRSRPVCCGPPRRSPRGGRRSAGTRSSSWASR